MQCTLKGKCINVNLAAKVTFNMQITDDAGKSIGSAVIQLERNANTDPAFFEYDAEYNLVLGKKDQAV